MGIDEMREEPSNVIKFPPQKPLGFTPLVQPSQWSCLPTAFCMVMGVSVQACIARLGHDDERGFHPQELLGFALDHGWVFSQHEVTPMLDEALCRNCKGTGGRDAPCTACNGTGIWLPDMCLTHIDELMLRFDGVLTGRVAGSEADHAVAWCHVSQQCVDPKGTVYSIGGFEPDAFWLGVGFHG